MSVTPPQPPERAPSLSNPETFEQDNSAMLAWFVQLANWMIDLDTENLAFTNVENQFTQPQSIDGNLDLGGHFLNGVERIYFNAQDWIRWLTAEGLEFYENDALVARIGTHSWIESELEIGDDLTVGGDAAVGGQLYAGVLKQGSGNDRVVSWGNADFYPNSIVMARYHGPSAEREYGQTTSGSSLQICNVDGGNQHGYIGKGTWQCLGYAENFDSSDTARSGTIWLRIA